MSAERVGQDRLSAAKWLGRESGPALLGKPRNEAGMSFRINRKPFHTRLVNKRLAERTDMKCQVEIAQAKFVHTNLTLAGAG